jgi:hypothetical protein
MAQCETIFVDNLRIHSRPEAFRARLEEFFAADRGQWEEAGLADEFGKLRSAVEALKTSGAPLLENAVSLNKRTAEYRELQKRRNQVFARRKLAEFDKAFPGVWGYGVTHSLEKVFREDSPFRGRVGGGVDIALARNEREAFQIVLRSRQTVGRVTATVSDLVHGEAPGAILKAEEISVYPVGYVKPLAPPYPTDEFVWYPDPLLNFLPDFTLDAGVWQPIWFDVRGENVPALNIPVEVTVWNFTLPKQNSLPAVVAHGSPAGFYRKNLKINDTARIERDAEDLLLRHRITPSPIYNAARAATADEVLRWQAAGGKEYNRRAETARGRSAERRLYLLFR